MDATGCNDLTCVRTCTAPPLVLASANKASQQAHRGSELDGSEGQAGLARQSDGNNRAEENKQGAVSVTPPAQPVRDVVDAAKQFTQGKNIPQPTLGPTQASAHKHCNRPASKRMG